jgi:3-phosphoshikimate 1-carboxyvinyltransferase
MNKKFSVLINKKIKKFNKIIQIPGDKSCSIRAVIFASQCIGISSIKNLLESEDVLSSINALRSLKVKIKKNNNIWKVHGNGHGSFINTKKIKIYIGNSGTTARLLIGLLATNLGKFYLYGDKSMNKRDMSRVFIPLEKIGAFFYPPNKKTLPITIQGTSMPLAQSHIENIGSAQVKSCLLAAFLNTPGRSNIVEKKISRNHTEIILKKISANIKINKLKKGNLISVTGQKNLHAFNYSVSSDPSSAAFFIALALLIPNAKLKINNCLCNKSRMGFYKVLKEKARANIKINNLHRSKENGELVGSIVSENSSLRPINCPKELIPSLIDELPILFVIAALTKGISKFYQINEATKKESNRIMEMKKILIQAGIKCKSTKDNMIIYGNSNIVKKNKLILVDTKGDHRICMSATILALATGIKIKIKNFETVNTSFPNFIKLVKNLGGKFEIK